MDLQTRVQTALDQVVEQGLECGCQAALFIDGKLEVSAAAGWTDWSRTRKVDEDTIFPVYSTGKAPCSTVVHRLVEQGLVDYDTPLRDFWPEFACNGKEDMRVWHILTYRAGLYMLPQATPQELADFWTMTEKMAAAKPACPIGGRQQYHPITYGWLCGGIACHVLGRRDFPQIFRELVGTPANMNRWFYGAGDEEALNAAYLVKKADGSCYDPEGATWMNQPLFRRCCNPAACTMANALSIARHYATLDSGLLLSPQTIENALIPRRAPDDPFELVQGNWALFGLGYILSGPVDDLSRIFGHGGWSGAQGLLDRKRHYAIGFTRNLFADPNASLNAFYKAIDFQDRPWPPRQDGKNPTLFAPA